MKHTHRKKIEQQWERALEQAQENQARDQAFDKQELNNAAGLQIRSGVQAGRWHRATYTLNISCDS